MRVLEDKEKECDWLKKHSTNKLLKFSKAGKRHKYKQSRNRVNPKQ